MAFRIEISESARGDIDEAVSYIADDPTDAASKWLTTLESLVGH